MDGDHDAFNLHNWGHYEPSSVQAHLRLQLMSTIVEQDMNHFLPARDPSAVINSNGAFHSRESVGPEAPVPTNWMRNEWINHNRDKFLNMLPPNPSFSILADTSVAQPLHMLQPLDTTINEMPGRIEEPHTKKEIKQLKKRDNGSAQEITKRKMPLKAKNNECLAQKAKAPRAPRKKMNLVINGVDMDISGIPVPICSCTGTPHQCYRWGDGCWQSACCTPTLSVHPLPMSEKQRGKRIAGRKMSIGAFKKVLEKLAGEGYNFANPIDLRSHWARHGTNKFVTIK